VLIVLLVIFWVWVIWGLYRGLLCLLVMVLKMMVIGVLISIFLVMCVIVFVGVECVDWGLVILFVKWWMWFVVFVLVSGGLCL